MSSMPIPVAKSSETIAISQASASLDVIMLTTAHSATDPRIFHREARTLQDAGMSVGVIEKHPGSEYLDGIWIEALPAATNRWKRLLLGLTLLKRARQLNGKLYIFHDPELFGIGLILRILGKNVIYDCHENLPMQLLQKNWIPKLLRWLLVPLVLCFEWAFSRLLSGVIVANDCVVARFPRARTSIIRNLPPARSMRILAEGR